MRLHTLALLPLLLGLSCVLSADPNGAPELTATVAPVQDEDTREWSWSVVIDAQDRELDDFVVQLEARAPGSDEIVAIWPTDGSWQGSGSFQIDTTIDSEWLDPFQPWSFRVQAVDRLHRSQVEIEYAGDINQPPDLGTVSFELQWDEEDEEWFYDGYVEASDPDGDEIALQVYAVPRDDTDKDPYRLLEGFDEQNADGVFEPRPPVPEGDMSPVVDYLFAVYAYDPSGDFDEQVIEVLTDEELPQVSRLICYRCGGLGDSFEGAQVDVAVMGNHPIESVRVFLFEEGTEDVLEDQALSAADMTEPDGSQPWGAVFNLSPENDCNEVEVDLGFLIIDERNLEAEVLIPNAELSSEDCRFPVDLP